MKISEKTLALIEKLRVMSNRGEDGERVNAEKMLLDLLKKLGMTLKDLDRMDRKEIKIKCTREQYDLGFAHQIIANVVGKTEILVLYRGSQIVKTGLYVQLTDSEYIEIEAKMDFYWKHYVKERKTFYNSFIMANDLYSKEPSSKQEDLTPEKIAQHQKEARLAMMLDKQHFIKQLQKG